MKKYTLNNSTLSNDFHYSEIFQRVSWGYGLNCAYPMCGLNQHPGTFRTPVHPVYNFVGTVLGRKENIAGRSHISLLVWMKYKIILGAYFSFDLSGYRFLRMEIFTQVGPGLWVTVAQHALIYRLNGGEHEVIVF